MFIICVLNKSRRWCTIPTHCTIVIVILGLKSKWFTGSTSSFILYEVMSAPGDTRWDRKVSSFPLLVTCQVPDLSRGSSLKREDTNVGHVKDNRFSDSHLQCWLVPSLYQQLNKETSTVLLIGILYNRVSHWKLGKHLCWTFNWSDIEICVMRCTWNIWRSKWRTLLEGVITDD